MENMMKVIGALLRIAQTKGAISNKEMDLFLAPSPKNYQDEQVWIDWIQARQEALRKIRSRLATGTGVANPASQSQVNQFDRMGNISLPQDDQSLVDKYL